MKKPAGVYNKETDMVWMKGSGIGFPAKKINTIQVLQVAPEKKIPKISLCIGGRFLSFDGEEADWLMGFFFGIREDFI